MTKTKTLEILNDRIDRLILAGKTKTAEYKRLTRLHYKLTHA